MGAKSTTLLKNEFRMLWNRFVLTITTPSMLAFYSITIFGAYIVSNLVSILLDFEPLVISLTGSLDELLTRDMVFTAVGFITASAILAGYFGTGPASVMNASDENSLMPAPAKPYQLFLTRYLDRLVRKGVYFVIALFIFFPLILNANFTITPLLVLITAIIIFIESNYMLGGVAAYMRIKLEKRLSTRIRHIVLPIFIILLLVPTLPPYPENPVFFLSIPSNIVSVIVMESLGILAIGIDIITMLQFSVLTFAIVFLLMAISCDYDFYELFAAASGREESEGRFIRMIRGQVDFSDSKFDDPVIWVVLKDFWSRMRTPLQFWKYVYVVFGTVFSLFLFVTQPSWLPPIRIPGSFAFSAVPAFLLVMLLFTQLASVSSLMSFLDEKENVYLLRVSPFTARDIVLAKYSLSVLEVTLASIPIYTFLVYIFRVQGALYLAMLGAPLIILFSATGVMVGAYIPVFTNEPTSPPVPIAFSFPVINLGLGSILMAIVALFSESAILLVVLPIYVVGLVLMFLALSMHALNSYR